MEVKINWEHKRVKHAIEKMWLRGISVKEVEAAVTKGKRVFQRSTGLIESFYSHFIVVFDERRYSKVRKIFPVTIKIR